MILNVIVQRHLASLHVYILFCFTFCHSTIRFDSSSSLHVYNHYTPRHCPLGFLDSFSCSCSLVVFFVCDCFILLIVGHTPLLSADHVVLLLLSFCFWRTVSYLLDRIWYKYRILKTYIWITAVPAVLVAVMQPDYSGLRLWFGQEK